jgi:hypothetical protein
MQHGCFARTVPFAALGLLTTLFAVPQSRAQFAGNAPSSASAYSIPESQQIQPEALNRLLQAKAAGKPLVLQVGSRIMFGQAHIPGSQFAGPGSQPGGLQLLESKVASTPKNALIVIYCGCCPWNRCPNVGPAYARLHDLGFTNVKVLYMANNFGDDWVAKGYRVEQGQ